MTKPYAHIYTGEADKGYITVVTSFNRNYKNELKKLFKFPQRAYLKDHTAWWIDTKDVDRNNEVYKLVYKYYPKYTINHNKSKAAMFTAAAKIVLSTASSEKTLKKNLPENKLLAQQVLLIRTALMDTRKKTNINPKYAITESEFFDNIN